MRRRVRAVRVGAAETGMSLRLEWWQVLDGTSCAVVLVALLVFAASRVSRAWRRRAARAASVTLVVLVATPGSLLYGRDAPVITISHHNLTPQRIEVHVGEVVRWRAAGRSRLQLRFDAHPGAHEVIMRAGEIRAVFLEPGEHWYSGSVLTDGERVLRGVVIVGTPELSPELPRVCGPGSSRLICIDP